MLVKYNDPILYQPTKPVDFVSIEENVKLANDLILDLVEHRALGLSANQAGFDKSMFVVLRDKPVAICNPQVVYQSAETESFWEGCLTFPKLYMMIKRPVLIKVEYQTPTGTKVEEDLLAMDARVFLHEMHHMRGEAFFHKNVSWFKLNRACADLPQYREFLRSYWNRTQPEFSYGPEM